MRFRGLYIETLRVVEEPILVSVLFLPTLYLPPVLNYGCAAVGEVEVL